jgi:NUMOD4 motif
MTDNPVAAGADFPYWHTDPEWATWPGFSRYEASHRGAIRNLRRGRTLAVTLDPDGYERLNLYADDGTRPNVSVARCVLLAHAGPPGEGEEACHGPGGRRDNRWPENLSWGSKEKNNGPDKAAAGTLPTPNPTYPCKDGCGQLVINEGRRCPGCVKRVGREAAAMLGHGVNLYDVAEHFGYTQPDWVYKLATEHGGCTLTKREALAQQPSMSQRVATRLVTLSRRRGWRSETPGAPRDAP